MFSTKLRSLGTVSKTGPLDILSKKKWQPDERGGVQDGPGMEEGRPVRGFCPVVVHV